MRGHWAIENQLHWRRDNTYDEERCRIRHPNGARVMASLLYGINLGDWTIFAGVAAFLAAIAITASYIPARRATQVDPMVTLRNE